MEEREERLNEEQAELNSSERALSEWTQHYQAKLEKYVIDGSHFINLLIGSHIYFVINSLSHMSSAAISQNNIGRW